MGRDIGRAHGATTHRFIQLPERIIRVAMMLYLVFNTESQANAAITACNAQIGYPNEATDTDQVAATYAAGTKWVVEIADWFPPEWFSGIARLTKAEAEAAGAVF